MFTLHTDTQNAPSVMSSETRDQMRIWVCVKVSEDSGRGPLGRCGLLSCYFYSITVAIGHMSLAPFTWFKWMDRANNDTHPENERIKERNTQDGWPVVSKSEWLTYTWLPKRWNSKLMYTLTKGKMDMRAAASARCEREEARWTEEKAS